MTEKNIDSIPVSKVRAGLVSRIVSPNTLKVAIRTPSIDKKYKKRTWMSKYLMVHDPDGVAKVGEQVLVGQTRPLSARKTHLLVKSPSML
jgi:ribosomal protein S17